MSFASVVSIALLALFADNGAAQTKADKIRVGYAARAVAQEGQPRFAQHKPAEFIDAAVLTEIDRSGYIDKLYASQRK